MSNHYKTKVNEFSSISPTKSTIQISKNLPHRSSIGTDSSNLTLDPI